MTIEHQMLALKVWVRLRDEGGLPDGVTAQARAKAILKLPALNGELEDYYHYHLRRGRERIHHARYSGGHVLAAQTGLRKRVVSIRLCPYTRFPPLPRRTRVSCIRAEGFLHGRSKLELNQH